MSDAISTLYRRAKPPANPDLTLVFMTESWQWRMHDVYAALDRVLPKRAVAIGAGAHGIIGTDSSTGETIELEEGEEGIAIACIRVPKGNRVHAFGTGCAGIEGSSLDTTLTRIKNRGHGQNMAALAVADDFDAIVAADGAIKSHFPHAQTIGGLGGSNAPTKPLFVRSCEFQEAREVSGGPKHNCAVGALIEGTSCKTVPCVTRGITAVSEPCEVEQSVRSVGVRGPVDEVRSVRRQDTGEVETPVEYITKLCRAQLQVGVRSAEQKERNDSFNILRPCYADKRTGALGFDREHDVRISQGAEMCAFAVAPDSSDEELFNACKHRICDCDNSDSPARSVLGVFSFACAGRGHRWRKAENGANIEETKAVRQAVHAPLIGFFCNGEFGPRPATEQVKGRASNVSFPMGFTGVYGLLKSPPLCAQTEIS